VKADSVAVIVSVFINGDLQSWPRADAAPIPDAPTGPNHSATPNNEDEKDMRDDGSRKERQSKSWLHELKPGEKVEITIAYNMCHTQESPLHGFDQRFMHIDPSLIKVVRDNLSGRPAEEDFNLSSLSSVLNTGREDSQGKTLSLSDDHPTVGVGEYKSDDIGEQSMWKLENPSGKFSSSSPWSHLEYFTRRNLEHILSVCAITVQSDDKRLREFEKLETPSIALTCGDMAFHRVNTAASL
jgi:hypothetical protein